MSYLLIDGDPFLKVARVVIPVRPLGLAKVVIVRKETK